MGLVIQASFKSKSIKDVSTYLDPCAVEFFENETQSEVIDKLVHCLTQAYHLEEYKDQFRAAVLERESVASTGIGMGVALPHAKLTQFNQFYIAIGIVKKGIDWNAMDRQRVKLVLLIAGPDDKQGDYLNILSQLTLVLRDEELRRRLLNSTDSKQVIETFQLSQGKA